MPRSSQPAQREQHVEAVFSALCLLACSTAYLVSRQIAFLPYISTQSSGKLRGKLLYQRLFNDVLIHRHNIPRDGRISQKMRVMQRGARQSRCRVERWEMTTFLSFSKGQTAIQRSQRVHALLSTPSRCAKYHFHTRANAARLTQENDRLDERSTFWNPVRRCLAEGRRP